MSDPLAFATQTPRFGLPMLFAGQAQKETYVNEALLRTDLLLQGAVEGEAQSPPSPPQPGQAWLVGDAPTGDFAGHARSIAGWSEGGWRFVAPIAGMRVFDRASGCVRLFAGTWLRPVRPSEPTGGAVVDSEARAAMAELIEGLVQAGVLSSA